MFHSKKRLRGVKLPDYKFTEDCQTTEMPPPEYILLPMQQHIGAPCEPIVAVGEHVKIGQKVADSKAAFTAPIFSGISGKVTAIESFTLSNGAKTQAIRIENDFLGEVSESVQIPTIKNREDLINAVRDCGLVGLGGAGFPTHIKLGYKDIDRVDTLIVNAAECEPYITSDYRQCMEESTRIYNGIKLVMEHLEIKKCYIVFEENTPHSISVMREKTQQDPRVEICVLQSKYPKGAEKVAIYEAIGVVIKEGNLPADQGVMVLNVSTVSIIAHYAYTGMPLVKKRLTVDGDGIAKRGNTKVIIGTPIGKLAEYYGGLTEKCNKILMGGPMTGLCVSSLEQPVIKNNNAILFLSDTSSLPLPSNCIRCGRCIDVCPVNLMPASLEKAFDAAAIDELEELKVNLCVNCGSCSYVCPAKRNLAAKNQLAKELLRNAKAPAK